MRRCTDLYGAQRRSRACPSTEGSAMFKASFWVTVFCLSALVAARVPAAEEKKLDPPTPDEVKKTLHAYYKETWSKDWGNAKVEKLTIDITEPKIGEKMERQMY